MLRWGVGALNIDACRVGVDTKSRQNKKVGFLQICSTMAAQRCWGCFRKAVNLVEAQRKRQHKEQSPDRQKQAPVAMRLMLATPAPLPGSFITPAAKASQAPIVVMPTKATPAFLRRRARGAKQWHRRACSMCQRLQRWIGAIVSTLL